MAPTNGIRATRTTISPHRSRLQLYGVTATSIARSSSLGGTLSAPNVGRATATAPAFCDTFSGTAGRQNSLVADDDVVIKMPANMEALSADVQATTYRRSSVFTSRRSFFLSAELEPEQMEASSMSTTWRRRLPAVRPMLAVSRTSVTCPDVAATKRHSDCYCAAHITTASTP